MNRGAHLVDDDALELGRVVDVEAVAARAAQRWDGGDKNVGQRRGTPVALVDIHDLFTPPHRASFCVSAARRACPMQEPTYQVGIDVGNAAGGLVQELLAVREDERLGRLRRRWPDVPQQVREDGLEVRDAWYVRWARAGRGRRGRGAAHRLAGPDGERDDLPAHAVRLEQVEARAHALDLVRPER